MVSKHLNERANSIGARGCYLKLIYKDEVIDFQCYYVK